MSSDPINTSRIATYIVYGNRFFAEGYRGRVMHALGICEGFSENGWDVTLIGGEGLSTFANDLPKSVKCIEIKESKGIFKDFFLRLRFYRALRNCIRKNPPVLFVARYRVSSYIFLWVISLLLPKKTKKVLEVNSFAYHMLGKVPAILNELVAKLEMQLVNRFDLLYVVSESMSRDKRNKSCQVPIVTIPNGASSKDIGIINNQRAMSSAPHRLIYLGTLMPYWDFEYLAKAINFLHKHSSIKVVFLGDGPMRNYLEKAFRKPELVDLAGRFNRNDLGSLVDPSSDILILPPKTKEDMILTGGLSTKLFDYLSMKMPILAPSGGEIGAVLKDGNNSVLYSTDDCQDFAHCVNRLVGSPDAMRYISDRSYDDFVKNYSWKARMAQLIDHCG